MKSYLTLLFALFAVGTLYAQDYNSMPEEAMRQMQGGEDGYMDMDTAHSSRRGASEVRWVEQTYPSGDKYVGYMKGDMHHGQGAYYWADGSRYEGEFSKSSLCGFGTLYHADGTKLFEGEFKNDQPHGVGTLYFPNGRRYVGEWEDCVESGSGIL
jgi:hypothetical protein